MSNQEGVEIMDIQLEALKKAVKEIAITKGCQYAEDCVKGMLKLKQISLDAYMSCLEAVYE